MVLYIKNQEGDMPGENEMRRALAIAPFEGLYHILCFVGGC